MQTNITVLGGLPVTVEFSIVDADPDVGIFDAYVDDWYISHINGKICKKSPVWLYNRIAARKEETERIWTLCAEAWIEACN